MTIARVANAGLEWDNTNDPVLTITSTTAGNFIAVGVSDFFDNVTGITDNKGGGSSTYNSVVEIRNGGGNATSKIFETHNISSSITEITIVTSSAEYLSVGVQEYSGVHLTSPIDTFNSSIGTSATPATSTFTTTDTDLIFAVVGMGGSEGTITMDGGYSDVHTSLSDLPSVNIMDELNVDASSINPGWTLGSSRAWAAVGCGFIPAAIAAAGNPWYYYVKMAG